MQQGFCEAAGRGIEACVGVSTCQDGDGCCPSACDSATDNDCSTTCGNASVEANETCDPPESCPTSCSDGQACTADGDTTEQYVVGWSAGATYQLARVSATGNVLEGPTTITTAKWGERDDPFRDHQNGDIVWAWFDSAGSTTLTFARLRSGGTASCAQL